jgi:hypothetical protein
MDPTQRIVAAAARAFAGRDWDCAPAEGGWRLTRGEYELTVGVSGEWVCAAAPLAALPPDVVERLHTSREAPQHERLDHCRPGVWTELLLDCRRRFWAKYALGDDGRLQVQAEMPAVGLDGRACQWLLQTAAAWLRPERPPVPAPAADFDICSVDLLRDYFATVRADGWVLKDRLAANQWYLGLVAVERFFEAYLSVDSAWVGFQVPLLSEELRAVARVADRGPLNRFLLRGNDQMFWAKFGCDEDGQVVLGLDLPVELFDLKRFRLAARTLATYARDACYEVQILADLRQEPHIASLLAGSNG